MQKWSPCVLPQPSPNQPWFGEERWQYAWKASRWPRGAESILRSIIIREDVGRVGEVRGQMPLSRVNGYLRPSWLRFPDWSWNHPQRSEATDTTVSRDLRHEWRRLDRRDGS